MVGGQRLWQEQRQQSVKGCIPQSMGKKHLHELSSISRRLKPHLKMNLASNRIRFDAAKG